MQPKTTSGHTASKTMYLLALGDSLASGYQPTDGTTAPPIDPATGFSDQGYPKSYAADLATVRHLGLVDLACPGETTASMVNVPAETKCATEYKGQFGATSQLQAARIYLARHPGKISLLTFDLGANDIDACGSSKINLSCLSTGQSEVTKQLPSIVATLSATLHKDDPKARFVAMNYYDPFLGESYSPGGLLGTADAALSVAATATFNSHLNIIFKKYDVSVANVASAFRTNDALPAITYNGHRLANDVGSICRWTWMCPPSGSGLSQNIHPNTAGYQIIASAFSRVLTTT
jgi:lysophospholipase L1-like esterase